MIDPEVLGQLQTLMEELTRTAAEAAARQQEGIMKKRVLDFDYEDSDDEEEEEPMPQSE